MLLAGEIVAPNHRSGRSGACELAPLHPALDSLGPEGATTQTETTMLLRPVIPALASVCLAVFATACADGPSPPSAPSPLVASTSQGTGPGPVASMPAPTQPAVNFEVRFMTGMIDHHQMAIEMASMCLEKAIHPELSSMCEQIIAAQSAEIQEMQAWLQNWYGISYSPTMKPGDQQMHDRMASLSAAEFEIAFMEMMTKHHEKAIKEARQCLDKAWHTELRQLCESIIAAQSAEIAQLETWLCEWYDRCK